MVTPQMLEPASAVPVQGLSDALSTDPDLARYFVVIVIENRLMNGAPDGGLLSGRFEEFIPMRGGIVGEQEPLDDPDWAEWKREQTTSESVPESSSG